MRTIGTLPTVAATLVAAVLADIDRDTRPRVCASRTLRQFSGTHIVAPAVSSDSRRVEAALLSQNLLTRFR